MLYSLIKRNIPWIAFAITLSVAFNASAGTILMGDKEWRQLTETKGFSYNQIATVCDIGNGICSGGLGSVSFDGWVWASIYDVANLFSAVSPFPGGLANYLGYGTWATAFFTQWEPTSVGMSGFPPAISQEGVTGITRTDVNQNGYAQLGQLVDYFNPAQQDLARTNTSIPVGEYRLDFGTWLYRPAEVRAPVPEPATLALYGIGLAGIGYQRRKRAA